LNFDVSNDLAIVRVKTHFSKVYAFAPMTPVRGQKIYSVGLPGDTAMTLVEALFGGVQYNGPIEKYVMSAPLNRETVSRETSGGPVVNALDQLVGVNNAILGKAQNISFFVPASKVVSLLFHTSVLMRDRSPASQMPVSRAIRDQVQSALHPWIESWKSRASTATPLNFGDMVLADAPPHSKCWEDRMGNGRLAKKVYVRTCHGGESFPLTVDNRSGSVDLSYARTDIRNDFEALFGLNAMRSFFLASADLRFRHATSSSEHSSRYVCNHRFVKNSRGAQLMTEYCATTLKALPGLYDVQLTATTLNAKPGMVAQMFLQAFPGPEALMAADVFLEGIGTRAAAGAGP
jgi:hypothetical protein